MYHLELMIAKVTNEETNNSPGKFMKVTIHIILKSIRVHFALRIL